MARSCGHPSEKSREVSLETGGLFGAYGGTYDPGEGVVFYDFERVALQGAHLDHLLEVVLEHGKVDEADVEAGEVELAGAGHVDGGGGGGGEGLVP